MVTLTALVVVANTITLVFGAAIVSFAYRAHRRTGSRALRALTIGLGLVTIGALFGGLFHQLAGGSLLQGVAVQSGFSAAGFVVLAYSLVADEPVVDRLSGTIAQSR